ncbi:alpha/beta fold hydrolase [Kitasatospora sp. RB6PN24]|uniref:alpha/beta hydrolase n=1 Tax=Kitasatospora humi TaxID=2893891 RepID=UPI001E2A2F62|nr:alpha/beta hydrolase [Kitasatospora humi]MCC9307181.1 alpha/beta fold hydrolase [Kitasatospora humi]
MSVTREKVRFASGGTECAAWHYPGTNGACVIMAAGLGVTKEPGTDPFAKRFHAAGFSVLAFDHRGLGESGGTPRQVVRAKGELADWEAAIAFAPTLPGVDPTRLALWGFSLAGGHVVRIAARHPELAAVIAQTPAVDGQAVARNAMRHQTPSAVCRFTALSILDALAGLFGRRPFLIPLAARPGTVAVLTTPDSLAGPRALDPGNDHPDWQQAVAARSTLGLAFYRPGRDAARVRCPLLVVACDQDRSALADPAVEAARQAPRGKVVLLSGEHYAPFMDAHEQAVEAELAFLRRHLGCAAGAWDQPARPGDRI